VATRMDPFREMERWFDQALATSQTAAAMPMDLFRTGDHYVIRVDLPGADPGSIDVSVDDRMLIIRGQRTAMDDSGVQWLVQERPSGTFARQIALGRGVSLDNISATYADGVLSLSIPVAADAKPRRIDVAHASSGSAQSVTAGDKGSSVDADDRKDVSSG
jgi:HSP20 family protein